VVRLPRKSEKAFALSTAALDGADLNDCLDADGQHDQNNTPKVVQPIIENKIDTVIGSRFLEAQAKELIPSYRRLE